MCCGCSEEAICEAAGLECAVSAILPLEPACDYRHEAGTDVFEPDSASSSVLNQTCPYLVVRKPEAVHTVPSKSKRFKSESIKYTKVCASPLLSATLLPLAGTSSCYVTDAIWPSTAVLPG